MNSKQLIAAAVAVLVGSATSAQVCGQDNGPEAGNVLPQPSMSRAEARAEREIYRRSGLADVQSGDSPATFNSRYAAAAARYSAMRASPQFAALVQFYAEQERNVAAKRRNREHTGGCARSARVD